MKINLPYRPAKSVLRGVGLASLCLVSMYAIFVGLPALFMGLPLDDIYSIGLLPKVIIQWGLFALGMHLVSRALTRIPYRLPAYRQHLQTTPWRRGSVLPKGAYRFDLFVWSFLLTIAVALGLYDPVDACLLFCVAFASQIVVGAVLLRCVRSRFWIWTYVAPLASIVLMGAGWQLHPVLASLAGLTLMLVTDHFVMLEIEQLASGFPLKPTPRPKFQHLGWPSSSLRPDLPIDPWLLPGEWLPLSLLGGVFAAMVTSSEPDKTAAVLVLFGLFAGGAALVISVAGMLPSVGLVGRLFRGPRCIPRYDIAYLPILIIGLIMGISLGLLSAYPAPQFAPWIVGPAVVFICASAFRCRPSRRYMSLQAPVRFFHVGVSDQTKV